MAHLQGFSIANIRGRRGDDPRNSLSKEYVRAVRVLRLQIALIENVSGLATKKTSEGSKYLDIIRGELEDLGYDTFSKILHAQDYGIPQIRPRLIIIATRTQLHQPYPSPSHETKVSQIDLFSNRFSHVPLWSAISDLPIRNAREGAEVWVYVSPPENSIQNYYVLDLGPFQSQSDASFIETSWTVLHGSLGW